MRTLLAFVFTLVLSFPAQAENLQDLNIGYSRLRISLPVFVAKEQGFFERHGINAKLEMYETAQPLMQALISGRIDVAGYTALPITYNGMLRSGKKLYFLTTMVEDQDHRISYLLKKEGSGISSVHDLKGKTVGILPTIAYKAWFEAILRKHDLKPAVDVKIQQIAPMQQPQALKNGGVDALFTNDPVATSVLQMKVGALISDQVEAPTHIMNPFPFGSFNVSQEWAEQHPDMFQKLKAAMNEAVDFVNKHPEEAKQAMRAYLPAKFQPHVEHYPNAKYLNTKASSQKTFQDVSDLYLKIGIIKKPLDLKGLIIE